MIPKYRAKIENSDRYVIGYLAERKFCKQFRIMEDLYKRCNHEVIDPSTLAINFPDMKDSENNPIFASLSESGKGGDICDLVDCDGVEYVYVYNKSTFTFGYKNINPEGNQWEFADGYEVESRSESRVIGIQN